MRIESSVTSLSWIPSEAIEGAFKLPFEMGLGHYDEPPPDQLDDLEALRRADRFRFANELRAWIEVEDGRIVDAGYGGGGHIGATTLRLGGRSLTVAAVPLPDRRHEPAIEGDGARFVQTTGGRTGVAMPRTVSRPPFVQVSAPVAWTTLALELRADGKASREVVGASPFPRHWIYDADGKLCQKTGITDFRQWAREAFGGRTPWGDVDSPAFVTEVETALERELSTHIMRSGRRPRISTIDEGEVLVRQGEGGRDIFLLLDGVLSVSVDGRAIADAGPGAVLGERALFEGGTRTATLTAVTRCRVAAIDGSELDQELLRRLTAEHKRELQSAG